MFDPNVDLVGADQAALASLVNTNATDLSLTTNVFTPWERLRTFLFRQGSTRACPAAPAVPLVDGSNCQVVMAVKDVTGNIGVGAF